jgi:hypothetical protein
MSEDLADTRAPDWIRHHGKVERLNPNHPTSTGDPWAGEQIKRFLFSPPPEQPGKDIE